MIESENVILPENHARTGCKGEWFGHLAPVDIDQGSFFRYQSYNALMILENAVLAEYMRAGELNILRYICFGATDAGEAVLDVIDQALRHERVLVQVHQVWRFLRGEDTHSNAVLLHGDSHLGEYRLALQANRFGSLQLLFPSFIQF